MTIYSGNAAVYEQHRMECERLADEAGARGDTATAARFRRLASQWEHHRDADVRRQERRTLNHRVHRRTTWR